MKISNKHAVLLIAVAGAWIFAACAGAAATPVQSLSQQPKQQAEIAASQSPSQPEKAVPGDDTPSGTNSTATNAVNRVDVVYFHANQRCVTCLCFEEHINKVIDTYFQDALNSGKLTYQVLNLQQPENADISKKYRAVGSQLFVNVIIKGVDDIEDVQNIWNWKCTNDPKGFELKVKNIIEGRLKEIS